MYQYLTPANFDSKFEQSKTYTDSLTTSFPEYHRIASNKHKEGMDKHLPKNTDGTTSSIVHKTPRRVIQQLPTGVVECEGDKVIEIVATAIYLNEILPNANSQYELIEKCWQTVEGSLERGYAPIYCPKVVNNGYIGPDYTIPWWGDIFIQPGKLSDTDSNYIFLRSWWREEDIDAQLDKLKNMDKATAKDAGWDMGVLEEIKTMEQAKDDKAMTPTDRAQAINQRGGIELITGFQRGVGSQFITWHRGVKKPVRTVTNKDPRGEIPVNFNYCETDGTNPFGRGFVEMVAPLQNLMDSDDQMYQFNRALMLAPPVLKYGTWNKSQAQLVPNAIWDLGNAPTNKAEVLNIDSTALANYPAIYQLNQSRLYNLLSAPSNSIPSSAGGIQDSKTPEGVKQTNAVVSIDDNFIRKKFESSFANWSETAVNLYFADRDGVEEVQLDEDSAQKLRNLPDFDQKLLSDDNKVRVNFGKEKKALKFRIDASTTQKQSDQQQVETLTGLLQTLENTPVLQGVVPPEKLIAAWNSIVAASGVEDPEDLNVSEEDYQKHQEQQAQMQQQQAQAEQAANQPAPTQPKPLSESISLSDIYKDINTPADVKAQIMKLVGLDVHPDDLQNMIGTQATDHMAKQAQNLGQTADAIAPPEQPDPNNPDAAQEPQEQTQPDPNEGQEPAEQPQQGDTPHLSDQDHQAIQELQAVGVPDEHIGQGLAMLHSGMPEEDVVKHLLSGVKQ